MPWHPSFSVLIALAVALAVAPQAARAEPPPAPTLEVFTRPGCSHCARAQDYLRDLAARRPDVRVIEHDIVSDPAARARLERIVEEHSLLKGLPTFVVGDRVAVGFDAPSTTGQMLERWLGDEDAVPDRVHVPILGDVSARELGLPAFAITLGLVDGFNPCAMWVLLFLLSLLVNLQNRRRMALIGGTFVAVSAIAYYAFMTAWLGMFLVVGVARWLEAALGLVAIAAGAIHVKDFITPHRGPSLSIPERAKPKIYARVRRIVYAENVPGAIAATIGLAVMVNLVELLCTAGLPAIFTKILAAHGLSWWEHHAYMLLYIAAYMLDDMAMLTIAVLTLTRRKVQERAGRVLKLVSGAVMILLGLLMVLRPDWLRFG